MNEADKQSEGVPNFLARFLPALGSWPRFSMLGLKMGAGYAAMAIFAAAALLYSTVTLYQINKTTRQRIAGTDIPMVTALIKMRASLLAQENFAGKYAIFKDPTFIKLYRQRSKDALANLEVLERTRSIRNIGSLKKLYLDYQAASERLFAGQAPLTEKRQASALLLLTALDESYIESQGTLQRILNHADAEQKRTIARGIGICCAGFLLAVLLARVTVYRVTRALEQLQNGTRRIAAGDFHYHPLVPAAAEISDLTSDFNQIASRVIEVEQLNLDAQPLTRLPGNQAIERVLDERLQSGLPFSFCHLELVNFQPFLAQHGYGKAGELLYETGILVYKALKRLGAADDFAGHAGGEHFVMVVAPEKEAAVCEAVVNEFDAELIKRLASREEEPAEIHRCDGDGGGRSSPIPSVSITVLECDNKAYSSAVEIARAAVEARETLKRGTGSGTQKLVDQPGR